MIDFDVQGHLAVITLNRPQARNAIDPDTTRQIAEAFDRIETDNSILVTIITGSPPVVQATYDDRSDTLPA